MARPRKFVELDSLEAAIRLFCEHGYEGTSTEMLVQALGVGRQSLYNSFGDKWQMYCAALNLYCERESQCHIAQLASEPRAIDGIRAMVRRLVVEQAHVSCLATNSVCEFGERKTDLAKIRESHDAVLRPEIIRRVREAQADGDLADSLDPDSVVDFIYSSFSGIRIAARGGLPKDRLRALGDVVMRCLQ
ncbi:MAG: TetR/AcrR family transcriptional regulator [Hansschlegelia sp.]